VISGEQQGVVGHTISIANGVLDVKPKDDDIPLLQVPPEQLLPIYRPGDHVKGKWSEEHGIIMPSEEPGSVSFIDTCMQNRVRTYVIASIVAQHIFQFTTHIYFMTPYTPPHNFYQFKPGTWVDFCRPKDTERPKQHGQVHSVEDLHALVIKDRMQEEVCE
jgi:protein tyrosine phosphatase